jgi:hypothetical protein
MHHQGSWFRFIGSGRCRVCWQETEIARVEGNSIDQYRERRPVRMMDRLLVLEDGLTLLDGPQGRKLLQWEGMAIHAAYTDVVFLKKCVHGLPWPPGSSKYGSGGTIGKYQSRIAPPHQVDTAG